MRKPSKSSQKAINKAPSQGNENRAPYIMMAALVLLLLLSLYLRLLHVDFGLPSFLHVDEKGPIWQTQYMLAGHASVVYYNHPPLLKNLAYVGLKIYLASTGKTTASDQEVVLALRLFSVLAGVGAVAFLYLLALHFVGHRLAFGSAFLYAILPLTVVSSKYGVPDMLLSCLFIVSLWLSVKLYEKPRLALYAATGFVLLLAIGAKYPGGFLVLPALLAHFTATRREAAAGSPVAVGKSLGGFLLGALIGLFVSFPFLLLEFSNIIDCFASEVRHVMVAGHYGFNVSGKDMFLLYHFRYSILPATGPLLLTLIPVGLIIMAMRHKTEHLILMSAVVPYYLIVEWANLIFPAPERYILPLVGPYVLAACIAVEYIIGILKLRRFKLQIMLVLVFILSAWPVYKTSTVLYHMVPDTRQVMGKWMNENLEPDTPVFAEKPASAYYPDQKSVSFKYNFYYPDFPLLILLKNRGAYILTSSFVYDRYLNFPDQRPEMTSFYRALFEKGILIHEATGENQYLFHNPVLRLYRIP